MAGVMKKYVKNIAGSIGFVGSLVLMLTGCGFLSSTPARQPAPHLRFNLPVKDPAQILMVSPSHGWLVSASGRHLFYTSNGGGNWRKLAPLSDVVISHGRGTSGWAFAEGKAQNQWTAAWVSDAGVVWQRTVRAPGTRSLIEWGSSPHNRIGALGEFS